MKSSGAKETTTTSDGYYNILIYVKFLYIDSETDFQPNDRIH